MNTSKPCEHNCPACAEKEKEQMLIQIGKYEERISILEKLILALIDFNQKLINR